MAEAKKRLLTYAGLKALEDELEDLKVVKRKKKSQPAQDQRGERAGRPLRECGV